MSHATQTTERVCVKKSPIEGFGLFATAPIRKGELIGVYEGPRTTRDGRFVLWLTEEDGRSYGIKGTNKMRYMNHHAEPNAVFEETEIYALRDIQPGEEITVHYGEEWEDDEN